MIAKRARSSLQIATLAGLGLLVAASCGGGGAPAQADARSDVPAPDAAGSDVAGSDVAGSDAVDTAASDGGADVASMPDGGSDAGDDAGQNPCHPPAVIDEPAAMLSQTGCVIPTDPKTFAAKVTLYEVQSPVWIDGATLTRGLALPPRGKIHVKDCGAEPTACPQGPADDGRWVVPVGTVLLQNLKFDGKLVETRMLTQFDAGVWAAYTYQWDEAQTGATVVPDERRQITFNTGTRTINWTFLNRVDCLTCHTASAGYTLGLETAQQNRVVSGTNQLDSFQAAGLFDAPLPTPRKAALPIPYGGPAPMPPVESRARSYIHANCSYCHRPDGALPGLDLRYDVLLKNAGICGLPPNEGDLNVANAQILKPGVHGESIIWLRMSALPGAGRMPRIGSDVVDQSGVDLMASWIDSLASCPP